MAVTSATTGMKAIFSIGDGVDGGSTTYTKVGEVTSITPPSLSRATEDATHLESPDEHREFIAGLLDTDPANIAFNYVPSATDKLYTAMIAGKGDFQITYPNGVKLQFSGIPVTWKPGEASTSIMQGEFSVKPSGPPVLVPAA